MNLCELCASRFRERIHLDSEKKHLELRAFCVWLCASWTLGAVVELHKLIYVRDEHVKVTEQSRERRRREAAMSNPKDFTLTELRDILRELNYPTTETENELILRLKTADPSGGE